MTNQQIIAVCLLAVMSYILGRFHQSAANAKLLEEVQDEFDRATAKLADLEAERSHAAQAALRKDSIRRQEERDLSS